MPHRNSIGRLLASRFDGIRGFGRPIIAFGIAPLAFGVIGLMDEENAAATYATVLSLGGLIVAGAAVAKGISNKPYQCLLQRRRVRVHPPRHR